MLGDMMLSAVIVDDEQSAINTLTDILSSEFPDDIEIVGIAGCVSQGIEVIENKNPDVVFLDVHIKDGTGFDLLKHFKQINFKIIFISAYNDYALQAFKFSALDYILKPIDALELKDAIQKTFAAKEKDDIDLKIKALFNNIEPGRKNSKRLILNSLESIEIVEVSEIIRCEARNNYTEFFFLNGKKLLISKTLKEYDKLLATEGFFRLHASHLVNLKHIQKIDKKNGNMVMMKDESLLPISIKRKDDLLYALESL
jgi:two-component system, LytTR family, response regulator